MRQSRIINARRVAGWLIGGLVAANLLIAAALLTDWLPVKIALFFCLAFLPGAALLRSMHITFKAFSVGALYCLGLSIAVLMLTGLALNQLLLLLNVPRPLETNNIIIAWDIAATSLVALAIIKNRRPARFHMRPLNRLPKPAWLLLSLASLMPCLAVFGAFRLNNGGDGALALFTLCYGAVLIGYACVRWRYIPHETLALFVFILALSMLFMTSLRGWDIFGHDIEREFRAYTAVHSHAQWNMRLTSDPYNACLSITILPEMFAKLLNISGLMVFKVVLQVLFAACSVAVYALLRRYASKLGALSGAILFISYPTFINDSAMLTRQGVAYLFFSLAILMATNKLLRRRFRVLFLLCALGVVVSHYSTAYVFVALCLLGVAIKWFLGWWTKKPHDIHRAVLSPLSAVLVVAMTYIWYTQLTATSGGLITTIQKSFLTIPHLLSEDNRSSDTSAALLFAGGKTQADLYQSYIEDSQSEAVKIANPAYAPLLTSDNLPFTALGRTAMALGLNPGLLANLRQDLAKLLQVLAIAGVVLITYGWLKNRPEGPNFDLVGVSLAGLVLLVLLVLLPVLSINYGVLRAFQQELIFLIIPIVLLFSWATRRLRSWATTTATTITIVFIFLLFTGVFAQILGNNSPGANLNNAGLYYGLYYSPAADRRAFQWMQQHIPATADVRAANFNRAFMHQPGYAFSKTGILPSQISPNSYVYLDTTQIRKRIFYTYYDSSPLVLTFPLEYYDHTRDQIYSSDSARIYQ